MLNIFCSAWLFVERSPSAQSEVFGGVEHRRNQESQPVFSPLKSLNDILFYFVGLYG